MALSPKRKRVIAAQHGMYSAILRVPFNKLEARIRRFGVKKPLGFVEMLLCVCMCMCLLILFSFRDGLTVAMPPFLRVEGELSVIHPARRVLEGRCFLSIMTVSMISS